MRVYMAEQQRLCQSPNGRSVFKLWCTVSLQYCNHGNCWNLYNGFTLVEHFSCYRRWCSSPGCIHLYIVSHFGFEWFLKDKHKIFNILALHRYKSRLYKFHNLFCFKLKCCNVILDKTIHVMAIHISIVRKMATFQLYHLFLLFF